MLSIDFGGLRLIFCLILEELLKLESYYLLDYFEGVFEDCALIFSHNLDESSDFRILDLFIRHLLFEQVH